MKLYKTMFRGLMPENLFKSFKSCQTKSTVVALYHLLRLINDLCYGIGDGPESFGMRID